MSEIFIYTRECLSCGVTKTHSEMMQKKGKCSSTCLECNEKKFKERYVKKLDKWVNHPWKRDYKRIWGGA